MWKLEFMDVALHKSHKIGTQQKIKPFTVIMLSL